MKHIATVLFTFSVVLMTTTGSTTTPQSFEVTRNLTSMPLAFTENQGQWDERVLFRANAGSATMWFTSDGAVYQFTRPIATGQDPHGFEDSVIPAQAGIHSSEPDSIESIAIKASFVGANPDALIKGIHAMEYKCNYFIGNDPNEWHTDVPNYQAIVYEDIHNGIDLKYYGNGKQMEYDFIVSPGADPAQIAIQYEGAESISINDNGQLVVTTKWGEVVERQPVIYQIDNGSRTAIAGEYRLKGDNSFGFELSGYDPDLPLIIDPVLVFSTYLGGGGEDYGYDIAVDGLGSAYITGYTYSTDFPTEGEYQTDQSYTDAFVTRLNSSGNALVYSTYLGGSGADWGTCIAMDTSGNAHITGHTNSSGFPTTPDAYDTSYNGAYDAFVTKLSSTGSLVYSTYLGENDLDYGRDIVVDGSSNAYITGYTSSTDFPTTEGAFQQTFQGGHLGGDAFVTKLNSSGNGLVYSTYLGGSEADFGYGITVDGSGNAYITGYTSSTDFPTEGEYQTDQGGWDAFVTKLNSSGNGLIYSTYLGGSAEDIGWGIVVDGPGNAYVTGHTNSSGFPTTPDAYDTSYNGGYDAFVMKLSATGNLVYGTYLGGDNDDEGHSIAVNGLGNAFITGHTLSSDFPTEGAYQTNQDTTDAFVTKLNSPGSALAYSTYFGGCSVDKGRGIVVDGSGNAYITGGTSSTDFPTTPDAYDTGFNGYYDAFVTKFDFGEPNDVVEFDPDNLPTDYNMSQSYPNPFNPTTTIEFNLPKRSNVTVKIYNVLGQQVQSLVDQELSVGNYKVTWDGSTFGGGHASTGVYFYRIVTEDFTETKKMVLLK